MKINPPARCISLIIIGLWCFPCRGQIRVVANERGELVYVNDVAGTPDSRPVNAVAADKPAQPASRTKLQPDELDQIVENTAQKHRVDPRLVRAVIKAESNWNTAAVSHKGALGLMQLHPFTAQQLGVSDALDPAQNVDGGVRYLGMMLERYKGDLPLALAAYNAGPGAVDRSGGVPRIAETRNYIQKVTSAYFGGTGLRPAAAKPMPIYRVVEADGRVVFRNE